MRLCQLKKLNYFLFVFMQILNNPSLIQRDFCLIKNCCLGLLSQFLFSVYVAEQSLYELSWKGLSFSFPTLNETSKVQVTVTL